MKGKVKWFGKSYGFITDPDGNDVFVHHKQIKMDGFRFLREGDIVSFELGKKPGNSRIQAINVEPVITLSMVELALGETIADAYGNRIYYKKMSLEQLAARAGIKVDKTGGYKMSKAYLVGHSWGCTNDDITIGIFLDKDKAEKYVDENNIPYEKAEKQQKMCRECRKCDDYDRPEDVFSLADECQFAKIGVDRHGKYCENDKHGEYSGMSEVDYYYMSELDLLD